MEREKTYSSYLDVVAGEWLSGVMAFALRTTVQGRLFQVGKECVQRP